MAFASELKRKETAAWWSNPETFATSLLVLLIDEFGTDAMTWEPETIRLEINDKYGVQIPQVNMDKLMGLVVALTTDLFYQSVESFTHIANSLSGSQADFNLWDPVEADEAAWAITEVYINDPPPSRTPLTDLYSPDVRRYLGVILDEEGIITPPDILEIAIMSPQVKAEDETFADDPGLYEGFYRLSQRKAEELATFVKARIKKLIDEVSSLPLQHRDSQQWSSFLHRSGRTTQ
jgi:hypothetical protein